LFDDEEVDVQLLHADDEEVDDERCVVD